MSDKKLFPGVTQEEIIKKEQEELQRKIAQEKKDLQEKKDAERQAKRSKYIMPEKDLISEKEIKIDFLRNVFATCSVAFLAGSFFWTLWGMSMGQGVSSNTNNKHSINYTPFAQALRDAYVPFSNGRTKLLNQNTPVEHGKFAPTIGFIANMIVTLFGICAAVGASRRQKRRNSEIILHNNTVDMMLDLEDFKGAYNLNTYQVAQMIRHANTIISEMSHDKRIYFDMLLDGRINIQNNQTFLTMATHIMHGHLAHHPEDINRILSVYNWKSVPLDLLSEYEKYITDKDYKTR